MKKKLVKKKTEKLFAKLCEKIVMTEFEFPHHIDLLIADYLSDFGLLNDNDFERMEKGKDKNLFNGLCEILSKEIKIPINEIKINDLKAYNEYIEKKSIPLPHIISKNGHLNKFAVKHDALTLYRYSHSNGTIMNGLIQGGPLIFNYLKSVHSASFPFMIEKAITNCVLRDINEQIEKLVLYLHSPNMKPISTAIAKNNYDAVKMLLPRYTNDKFPLILQRAIESGNDEIIKLVKSVIG